LGLGAAGQAGTKLMQKVFGIKKIKTSSKTGRACPDAKPKTYRQGIKLIGKMG
jgi:hypothetical protein